MTFRISLLTSIDPVLRSTTCFAVAVDSPATVVITLDVLDDSVRRIVSDVSGIIEDVASPLEHACVSCAVREVLVPTLQRLRQTRKWDGALVALPVAADAVPVSRALYEETTRLGSLRGAKLGAVSCVLDALTVSHDVLGASTLADRDLELHDEDERLLGEVLAPMITHADLIVAHGWDDASAQARALVHHLRGKGSRVLGTPEEIGGMALLNHDHRHQLAAERVNPLVAAAPDCEDIHGVWTIVLESSRPFHPERLHANVRRMAGHRVRSRGHFWVPTRPQTACVWDGTGGQLSIGDYGRWGRRSPRTRIVVTGTGDERETIRAAFQQTLLTDDELQMSWGATDDALDEWLGA